MLLYSSLASMVSSLCFLRLISGSFRPSNLFRLNRLSFTCINLLFPHIWFLTNARSSQNLLNLSLRPIMRLTTLVIIWLSGCIAQSLANIPDELRLWGEDGPAGNNMATVTKRQATSSSTRAADSQCTNGPKNRACWSNGYSIATDFDAKFPTTGKTVQYQLTIDNHTCSPDGGPSRPCLMFNNAIPGPTLFANWGDVISVTVKNNMKDNGTSVHWHGVRQLNSNTQDGVNGITECPLAPGDTKTYTFQATQFGTSWFHSHFSSQYGDGAVGQLVINGPASANYDEDLGTYTVTDWYYRTAFQIEDNFDTALQAGQPGPAGDTILVNGTMKTPDGTAGKYSRVSGLVPGKKYRLRLINISVDNNIRVSLDGHPFQVITGDFVPSKPWNTDWILMAIGQRYDVIFTANQTVGNYWFRAEVVGACRSGNNFRGRGVFSYQGAPAGDPAEVAVTVPGDCTEPLPAPFVPNIVPKDAFTSQVKSLGVDLTRADVTTNQQNIVFWGVNMTAISIDWEKPTMQYIMDKNTSYPPVYNLIELPKENIVSIHPRLPACIELTTAIVDILDHPRDSQHSANSAPDSLARYFSKASRSAYFKLIILCRP